MKNITGRTTDPAKLGAVPKILIRKTGDKLLATYDDSGIFPEQSLHFLFNRRTDADPKYIFGLLKLSTVDCVLPRTSDNK